MKPKRRKAKRAPPKRQTFEAAYRAACAQVEHLKQQYANYREVAELDINRFRNETHAALAQAAQLRQELSMERQFRRDLKSVLLQATLWEDCS